MRLQVLGAVELDVGGCHGREKERIAKIALGN